MPERADCRHYVERTTAGGERVQRCKLDMADLDPFGCPDGCIFFEERTISDAGWTVERRDRDRPKPDRPNP